MCRGWATVIEVASISTISIDLSINDTVTPPVLSGSLGSLVVSDLRLVWSDVQVFNVSVLQPLLDWLSSAVLVPIVNKYLHAGIPIPLVGPIQLRNPTIVFKPDVLAIASDVLFVGAPPATTAAPIDGADIDRLIDDDADDNGAAGESSVVIN
jgi:hypothetical protein